MFVFALDRDLEVWDYSDKSNPKKIYNLIRSKHTLELSSLFEGIWQELWGQGLDKTTQILYIVGDNASFTDNRMVFIWLKSWRYFGGGDYYCTKAPANQLNNLPEIIQNSTKNPEDLEYLKDPKITVKKVFEE